MMTKQMIDECIDRATKELKTYRKFHRIEYAEHVERRIASLRRIREKAPKARIGLE